MNHLKAFLVLIGVIISIINLSIVPCISTIVWVVFLLVFMYLVCYFGVTEIFNEKTKK